MLNNDYTVLYAYGELAKSLVLLLYELAGLIQ
jgi:hypothetical protein